jgi:hypothetical protein
MNLTVDADYFVGFSRNETKKLEEAIEYLAKNVGKDSHKLLTDSTAKSAYIYISKSIWYLAEDLFDLFENHSYYEVLSELIKFLFDTRNETDFHI